MKKVFALVSGTVFLLRVLPATAQSETKSFAQWCEQKNSAPMATRKTIDVLLKEVRTTDCELADSKLRKRTFLYLRGTKISDLKPLAGLSNLTTLVLFDNQISDLKPLAGLSNLTVATCNTKSLRLQSSLF
jgi:internalin A